MDAQITAQSFAGDAGVIACTVKRLRWGPHGAANVALLLRTIDRGATWRQMPFTRDIWSFFRYPGFPLWPPEFVMEVETAPGTVTIVFRDEEVVYEPGGESLWRAALSRRGLWKIRRVRRMRYEPGGDDDAAPPPIELRMPAGFKEPDAALVARAAAFVGDYEPRDVPMWLWLVPALALGITIGAGDLLQTAGLIALMVAGLPLCWFLLDRRRQRREALSR